jgi:hypothetical protein
MLEQEAWGELSKDQFEEFLKMFGERFGEPSRHRRLSISFWNHKMNEVDTRIRITDGKSEIMQKVGDWENVTQWVRKERHVKLGSDAGQIFNAFKILRQLLPPQEPCQFIQFDNYVFKTEAFEIKLSHQKGKSNKYNFEVESLNDESGLDEILKDLKLDNLVTVTDVKFWDKWNVELNVSDRDLSDEEIRDLIKEYL